MTGGGTRPPGTTGSGPLDLVRRPEAYPGTALRGSVLLGVPVDDPDDDPAGGRWTPLLAPEPGGPGPIRVRVVGRAAPLGDVLRARGAAPVDARTPVAAYGSNADPRVLHRKLSAAGVSTLVPMRAGTLAGARLAASAHVSVPGYLPAAAAAAPGRSLPVVVAWFDEEQLSCVDATEPNYARVVLDGAAHPVVLHDDGRAVAGVTAYTTRWGVLLAEPAAPGQVALWQAVVRAQPAVAAVLGTGVPADDAAVLDAMHRLAGDPGLRDAVRDLLALVARPAGLAAATGAG